MGVWGRMQMDNLVVLRSSIWCASTVLTGERFCAVGNGIGRSFHANKSFHWGGASKTRWLRFAAYPTMCIPVVPCLEPAMAGGAHDRFYCFRLHVIWEWDMGEFAFYKIQNDRKWTFITWSLTLGWLYAEYPKRQPFPEMAIGHWGLVGRTKIIVTQQPIIALPQKLNHIVTIVNKLYCEGIMQYHLLSNAQSQVSWSQNSFLSIFMDKMVLPQDPIAALG